MYRWLITSTTPACCRVSASAAALSCSDSTVPFSVITPSSRFGRRDNHTVVCDDCGPTRGSKYYHVMWRDGRCQHCGRGVTVREHFARHKNAKFFCSGRCSAGFHNARRDARNALAREKVCEVCSQDFTATRRNAKTCSPACKQKAYRNRQRSQKGGDT